MPTISVNRTDLFSALGRTYTDDEFDELCFEFGIELDEVTSEAEMAEKEGGSKAAAGKSTEVIYRIDIPANRYDLLCIEGLVMALKVFLRDMPMPKFTVKEPEGGMMTMNVAASTGAIRPFVVCAVLRGVTMTQKMYDSFIDLQDKLHQNICRRRTLVAVGTHDLDTIKGPFTYEANAPETINFVPLTQTASFDGKSLLDFYREDPSVKHIKPYTDIIYDSPVYPVIYDADRTVLSLPPIINSEHSKITLDTRNIFIECTAVDHTKANIVLTTILAAFSQYTSEPYTVEPVRVVYSNVDSYITPNMAERPASARVNEIQSMLGVEVEPATICDLCTKMMLTASYTAATNSVEVSVPVTRSDILAGCDIIEDVAIAYGYNKLPKTIPRTATDGAELPINALTDSLRGEIAHAGYTECLTMALVSREENFAFLGLPDDESAVVLSNPKSAEFQIARTTLLPGLLKSLQSNRGASVREGLKLFEISDVLLLDPAADVGAVNKRRLAAVYMGPTSGLEVIHGLVDRVMQLVEVRCKNESLMDGRSMGGADGARDNGMRYYFSPNDSPTYFPGRCADIMLELPTAGGDGEEGAGVSTVKIGTFGTLHPTVLKAFGLTNPASAVELELEPFV
jgi:phenylalanyl-tRNA synthetase beta chain